MKTLQLSLIEKWFYLTKTIKKEDYRNITPYWCNRFILVDGETMPKKWWIRWFENQKKFETKGLMPVGVYLSKTVKNTETNYGFEFKQFDFNKMTLGYPKSTDTERILILEHKGIEIREGNPDLGAEPGKLYFVIKHGEIIERGNIK